MVDASVMRWQKKYLLVVVGWPLPFICEELAKGAPVVSTSNWVALSMYLKRFGIMAPVVSNWLALLMYM